MRPRLDCKLLSQPTGVVFFLRLATLVWETKYLFVLVSLLVIVSLEDAGPAVHAAVHAVTFFFFLQQQQLRLQSLRFVESYDLVILAAGRMEVNI